jgi:hypothetical protein
MSVVPAEKTQGTYSKIALILPLAQSTDMQTPAPASGGPGRRSAQVAFKVETVSKIR